MNNDWEDHYRTLQVHFMAEPEIIRSAYLRLSRKYHPDVNPSMSSEEKMKAINKAYEILSDPVSRKQYLVRWMKNYGAVAAAGKRPGPIHPIDFAAEPGRQVLLAYMGHLAHGRYTEAFEMLSNHDRERIPRADYIKWQTLVAAVFQLVSYDCELREVRADITLKGDAFEMAATLLVKVRENNHVMGRSEEDAFTKSVVLENKQWRVFLGYSELGAIIRRFEALATLKQPRQIRRLTLKRKAPWDSFAQAVQRKKFHEKAQSEQMRFNRYGNRFSLIVCHFDLSQCPAGVRSIRMQEAAAIVAEKLRNLDMYCRWQEDTLVILLPETDQDSAGKTAGKIKKNIEGYSGSFPMTCQFAEQRYASLPELFKHLELL